MSHEKDFVIDPEFEEYFFAAGVAADEELNKQLGEHKGPLDALKVAVLADEGMRVLLDGHRRYRRCVELGLPYNVTELEFPNRVAAKEWADSFQLSRRNLTATQESLVRARMVDSLAKRIVAARPPQSRSNRGGRPSEGRLDAVEDVARATGKTKRQLRRDIALANAMNRVSVELRKRVETWSRASILEFSALPEEQQLRLVESVDVGQYSSIGAALRGEAVEDALRDESGPVGGVPSVVEAAESSSFGPLKKTAIAYLEHCQRAVDELNAVELSNQRCDKVQSHLSAALVELKGWGQF